jgi:hypothetical protein
MSNPYEAAGRLRKAAALESALLLAWERIPAADREGRSLADALEGPDAPVFWRAAMRDADVKHPPSDATKALVISGLRRREEIVADPFAGIEPANIGPVTLRRVGL